MDLSPENARLMAENRAKAKAALQQRERLAKAKQQQQQAQSHATQQQLVNSNGKRPLTAIPADSTSPTAPNKRTHSSMTAPLPLPPGTSKALQQALASGSGDAPGVKHFQGPDTNAPLKNMIGTYVEYDLATLKNSKGGFLLESEEDDPRRRREREMREALKQKRLENAAKQGQVKEQKMSLDPSENPKCKHCGTMDVDNQLRTFFGVFVCAKDKAEHPDEYSLLTKTECKEDYLLTESELKDEEIMPHMLRPNPHRPTYSNMMLFLRCQVEAYAFSDKKWGSAEALDAEFARREKDNADKKSKKFAKKLQELRKKTKTNVWHKRVEGEHRHVFGEVMVANERGDQVQMCEECGFQIEVETF